MKWILLATTATVCAVQLVASNEASASGFMIRENSAESIATVYAGNASRADDVSTVFNNPAGMSWLQGSQVEFGSAAVFPSIKFHGNATVMGSVIPGNNIRNAGQSALIPHFYGMFELTDKLKAGIAVTVPFGNTVDYDPTWSGRYVNTKTAAITADINPNISYRINDRLSVAGGVSAQYLKLTLTSAIPQFLILSPTAPDGDYTLRQDGWAWGFNFGVLAEPWDGTRLGLTYRSKIDHHTKGSLNFNASPLLGLVSGKATTDLNLPASIGGSITQQITPDFSLSSDIQFTQWDVFKQVVAKSANPDFAFIENYRNSWMISVGGTYRLNDTWSLRGGLGVDQSPTTDTFRDSGVPDKSRYMLGMGFGYRFTGSTSLEVGYAHYFATGHASMNTSVNSIDPLTGAVILHGNYTNNLDYLALSLRTAL
jgi:long-chain fatty acid transport protein